MAEITKSPGTMANDATVGTVAWINTDNAKVSDNVYATVTLNNEESHYLKATDFGFSVPTNATIKGISVGVEGKVNSGSAYLMANIIKGGVIKTNANPSVEFSTIENYKIFGNSTYLFAQTWTPEDINNNGFGIAIREWFFVTKTFSVDHIRITVYYTKISPFPSFKQI